MTMKIFVKIILMMSCLHKLSISFGEIQTYSSTSVKDRKDLVWELGLHTYLGSFDDVLCIIFTGNSA